jgi:hypothetical protein
MWTVDIDSHSDSMNNIAFVITLNFEIATAALWRGFIPNIYKTLKTCLCVLASS